MDIIFKLKAVLDDYDDDNNNNIVIISNAFWWKCKYLWIWSEMWV